MRQAPAIWGALNLMSVPVRQRQGGHTRRRGPVRTAWTPRPPGAGGGCWCHVSSRETRVRYMGCVVSMGLCRLRFSAKAVPKTRQHADWNSVRQVCTNANNRMKYIHHYSRDNACQKHREIPARTYQDAENNRTAARWGGRWESRTLTRADGGEPSGRFETKLAAAHKVGRELACHPAISLLSGHPREVRTHVLTDPHSDLIPAAGRKKPPQARAGERSAGPSIRAGTSQPP